MKKLKTILSLTAMLLFSGAMNAHAGRTLYNQLLVDKTAFCSTTTFTLDLGSSELPGGAIDQISMQMVVSTANPAAKSVTDGVASTATITVSSMTALRGTQATNTLTISNNTNIAGIAANATVNVASNTYLAANNVALYIVGANITSNIDYVVGASSSATATNLAAAIRRIPGLTTSVSGSTVTVTCSTVGTFGNGKTISSSASTRLVVSASKLSGGINNVFFTLNGIKMTQGDQWNVGASSNATGLNIVSAINSYAPLSGLFIATSATATTPGVVTITVISSGTAGNAYTLTSSSAAILAAGGATFSGGKNQATLVFNLTSVPRSSVVLTEGVDFSAVTSSQATITSIKAAIDGNSTLSALVSVSTATGAVGTLTAKAVGANLNFGITASSPAALSISNISMYGGTDSAFSTNTYTVTKTAHGYGTGLALLLTKSAGTMPANLLANTTYFAIRVDANSFKLATTNALATAGTAIVISSQIATGGGTFTFTPLAFAGQAVLKWQASQDGTNFSDLSVTSVTVSGATTANSSTLWNFGQLNYRYLRLNIAAPTSGGMTLQVTGNGTSTY